jgi:acylpyruvate hydrolase
MRLVKFVEFGRKIVGIGRNYMGHVKEMGGQSRPEKPIIFLKPATSFVTEGNPIKMPRNSTELAHEVELGLIIGRKGVDIPQSEAMDYVGGYTVCLDMTARDLQAIAKKNGNPWSISKGFDTSCPVGQFIPKEQVADPHSLRLWCSVNGELRQDGNTSEMMFKIPELVSLVSEFFTLEAGDVILTGTPAGAGGVKAGDVIEAGLGDITKIKFQVITRDSPPVSQ